MADTEVADLIVQQSTEWHVNPLPFLAMGWWESGGLSRTITFTNEDGSIGRAFKGGDYGLRLNGEYGVRSYGCYQVYADVHGPFTDQVTTHQIGNFPAGSRIPDYRAAAQKWDDVIVSMKYLAINGPNGGWLNVYARCPYNYSADPIEYLLWFCKRAQGSIDWERWMAIEASNAAALIYADWLNRHRQPQEINWMEIVNGMTYGVHELSKIRDSLSNTIQGYQNLIEMARR